MPQLNPAPWFTIFIVSWLVLLSMMPKVLKHIFNHSPMALEGKTDQKSSWIWPWS
uniref:ATP synthase complex subunit 8 n=1 Tax=Salminus brasiliensis TaxID=930266 RepID=A0A1X9WD30_SALBR|nr:ATP synthase F0 subunit 8 [Salminus brasiliensis]